MDERLARGLFTKLGSPKILRNHQSMAKLLTSSLTSKEKILLLH